MLTQSLHFFPITICCLPLVSLLHLLILSLPNTVREALSHPGWRYAMVDERQALDDNGIWNLVPLPTTKMPFYMAIFKKGLYGATSGVCCSREDREGVLSSEISVWFETESLCLIWKIQSVN